MKVLRQFGLVGMFQLLLFISVLLATLTPLFRFLLRVSSVGFWEAATFIGLQLIMLACMIGGTLHHRWQIARKYGSRRFHASGAVRSWSGAMLIHLARALLACGYAGVIVFAAFTVSPWKFMLHPLVFGLQVLMTYELARTVLWLLMGIDRGEIEVFDNGFTIGSFRQWSWRDVDTIRVNRIAPARLEVAWADDRGNRSSHATTVIRMDADIAEKLRCSMNGALDEWRKLQPHDEFPSRSPSTACAFQ